MLKSRVVVLCTTDSNGDYVLGINCNGVLGTTVDVDACVILNNGVGASMGSAASKLAEIYQMGRCSGVKIQWIPQIPNDTTASFKPCYITTDRDGFEGTALPPFGATQALEDEKVKVYNWQRPWKKFFRTAHYKVNTKIPTLVVGSASAPTTASFNQNIWGQWHLATNSLYDTNAAQGCHIVVAVPGSTADTVYGTFIVTVYSKWSDRIVT